jgi:pimeloyl-ACP methyl ester carboxylesterase
MATLTRRRALVGLSALALGACRRRAPEAFPSDGPWRMLAFEPNAETPEGQRAAVYAPTGAAELPLLVALHGRGESGRGLVAGARDWRDDYAVERLDHRLRAPPLTREDLQGFVTEARLDALNAALRVHPYQGVCLACPYTPDLADRRPSGAEPFARFVTERLLPELASTLGVTRERRRVGIDGVSMGGRLALLVGLAHPEVFGSVGALQPALRVDEAPMFAELAASAEARGLRALALVSSDADPFLPAVRALAGELARRGVAHRLTVTSGPHDYAWNRGPGGAEMLLFHERAARALPMPG